MSKLLRRATRSREFSSFSVLWIRTLYPLPIVSWLCTYLAVVTETVLAVEQPTLAARLAHVHSLHPTEAHPTIMVSRLKLTKLLKLVILLNVIDEGRATHKHLARWARVLLYLTTPIWGRRRCGLQKMGIIVSVCTYVIGWSSCAGFTVLDEMPRFFSYLFPVPLPGAVLAVIPNHIILQIHDPLIHHQGVGLKPPLQAFQ